MGGVAPDEIVDQGAVARLEHAVEAGQAEQEHVVGKREERNDGGQVHTSPF